MIYMTASYRGIQAMYERSVFPYLFCTNDNIFNNKFNFLLNYLSATESRSEYFGNMKQNDEF